MPGPEGGVCSWGGLLPRGGGVCLRGGVCSRGGVGVVVVSSPGGVSVSRGDPSMY